MKVDEIITLSDGQNYGLLLDSNIKENVYFLAVLLKENEEPTDTFKVLKEVNENGETFVVEEKDPVILQQLLEDYQIEALDIEE